MKNLLLILALSFLFVVTLSAQQLSIGPVFGMNESGRWGRSILADSIAIVISNQARRDPAYGIFIDYEHNHLFSVFTQVSYSHNITGFTINNIDDTIFGLPIRKGYTLGHRIIDFSVLPSLSIPILKDVEFKLMVGASFNFQFPGRAGNIDFNGRHPGVAEAFNNMHKITDPFYINPAYGFSVTYKRFAISCRYQRNRGNYFTDEVTIYGVDYPAYFQFENWLFMFRYDLVRIDLSKDKDK